MKLFTLTKEQKAWLRARTISVGGYYSLPRWGFTAFGAPNYSDSTYVDINPFTKSLDGQLVQAFEISGDFVSVNFVEHPAPRRIWMEIDELAYRDFMERMFLTVICYLPMIVYNLIRK